MAMKVRHPNIVETVKSDIDIVYGFSFNLGICNILKKFIVNMDIPVEK